VTLDTVAFEQLVGKDSWECPIREADGLYLLEGLVPDPAMPSLSQARAFKVSCSDQLPHNCTWRNLWHQRLGHPGAANFTRLSSGTMVRGLNVPLHPCSQCPTVCDNCVRGKQAHPHLPGRSQRAKQPLERLHVDTVGPLPVTALEGCRYFITVVDEFTHYCAALPIRSKSNIPGQLKRVILTWQRQAQHVVRYLRCDRGTEFLNSELDSFCAAEGITLKPACAYTPQ
jgi:Integrase core domain/GAG-pre-integrase domain